MWEEWEGTVLHCHAVREHCRGSHCFLFSSLHPSGEAKDDIRRHQEPVEGKDSQMRIRQTAHHSLPPCQQPREATDSGHFNGLKGTWGNSQKRNAVGVQICRNHFQARKFLDCKWLGVGRVLGGARGGEPPALFLQKCLGICFWSLLGTDVRLLVWASLASRALCSPGLRAKTAAKPFPLHSARASPRAVPEPWDASRLLCCLLRGLCSSKRHE